MASLEHRLESSLDGTLGEISYVFSYVFYSSIKAITEAIRKWFHFSKYRQCIIIAPAVLTACLRGSIHQVRVYAFGSLTRLVYS